jgi:hypothetical protein
MKIVFATIPLNRVSAAERVRLIATWQNADSGGVQCSRRAVPIRSGDQWQGNHDSQPTLPLDNGGRYWAEPLALDIGDRSLRSCQRTSGELIGGIMPLPWN